MTFIDRLQEFGFPPPCYLATRLWLLPRWDWIALPLNMPAFAGRTSVQWVFPSTASRLTYQMMPSCPLICLSLLPACATQQAVCFHPSYRPGLRPVIPFWAGQVFSSDTVTRASRPYPRGPRSDRGYIVPVHQHLLTSSEPLACTLRWHSLVIRRAFAVRERLGCPRVGPSFHC